MEESQLGRLTLLQADEATRVYQTDFLLPGLASPAVYKKFAGNLFARARAVTAVADFRAMLCEEDRKYLDECARWPHALVCDQGRVLGFLLPALSTEFTIDTSRSPRSLHLLATEAVSVPDRCTLLGSLCEAVGFLHEHGWVFGNLSASTVAFSADSRQAMLLDCDGTASLTDAGRIQAHASGWAPPEAQAPQDERTDVYKLGLAIVAVLGPAGQAIPVADPELLRGVLDSKGVALVRRALSTDRSERPKALELAVHLRDIGSRTTRPAAGTTTTTITSHPATVQVQLRPENGEVPEPVLAPLVPGDPESVGTYRLLGRLGAGGMGTVFLGASPGGRRVAVKILHAHLAANPEFRARFAREVTAARLVNGFYTAPVLDAEVDADPPWLATAHVPGPTLRTAVRERGPLPAAAARALGSALAEGLAEIHRCRLVHRDLKPSNVILSPDGPRIIDFGVARALDVSSQLTATGDVIGTFAYMSPEQLSGTRVGPESDIFSLGSVLTYAATGHGPFDVPYPAELAHPSQPANLAGLPAELADVVTACLAKDPAQRPALVDLIRELAP